MLEAQIALPYAMAEFGAYSRALEGYEQAVTRFGTERQEMCIRDSVNCYELENSLV